LFSGVAKRLCAIKITAAPRQKQRNPNEKRRFMFILLFDYSHIKKKLNAGFSIIHDQGHSDMSRPE